MRKENFSAGVQSVSEAFQSKFINH